jgi:hypothetical protein
MRLVGSSNPAGLACRQRFVYGSPDLLQTAFIELQNTLFATWLRRTSCGAGRIAARQDLPPMTNRDVCPKCLEQVKSQVESPASSCSLNNSRDSVAIRHTQTKGHICQNQLEPNPSPLTRSAMEPSAPASGARTPTKDQCTTSPFNAHIAMVKTGRTPAVLVAKTFWWWDSSPLAPMNGLPVSKANRSLQAVPNNRPTMVLTDLVCQTGASIRWAVHSPKADVAQRAIHPGSPFFLSATRLADLYVSASNRSPFQQTGQNPHCEIASSCSRRHWESVTTGRHPRHVADPPASPPACLSTPHTWCSCE